MSSEGGTNKTSKEPEQDDQFLGSWMEQFMGACIAQDKTWNTKVISAIDSIRHLTPSQ